MASDAAVTEAALRARWLHRHCDVFGGWLRPQVFGAVDGLVTNASLIAGAFSMGTGEYVSVTNQNELVHAEVAVERQMLAQFPAAEQAELAETFRGYGADTDTAAKMAAAVSKDPDVALRVHIREELGLDHTDLPSAVLAGGASLAAFSVGAVLPLLPYLTGRANLLAAMVMTVLAVVSGGMVVGHLAGRLLARFRGSAIAPRRGGDGGSPWPWAGSSAPPPPDQRRARACLP